MKNKTYREDIQQLIDKGEVEEVDEDPRKTKTWTRVLISHSIIILKFYLTISNILHCWYRFSGFLK